MSREEVMSRYDIDTKIRPRHLSERQLDTAARSLEHAIRDELARRGVDVGAWWSATEKRAKEKTRAAQSQPEGAVADG